MGGELVRVVGAEGGGGRKGRIHRCVCEGRKRGGGSGRNCDINLMGGTEGRKRARPRRAKCKAERICNLATRIPTAAADGTSRGTRGESAVMLRG